MRNCGNLRFLATALGVALVVLGWAGPGRAELATLAGNVTTPGGTFVVDVSANFTSSGNTLTIALSNNKATPDPYVVLTNVEWSLNAPGSHPSLTLTSLTYGTNTALFDIASHSSTPLLLTATYDMWGFKEVPNGQLGQGTSAFFSNEYGVSAIGGGMFQGNHGFLNNIKSGLSGDDYGIVGPGTNLSQNNLNNQLPLVKNTGSGASTLIFTFTGFSGFIASEITDVHFGFGSAPTIAAAAPEPSTLVIAGVGALGLMVYRLRRRHAK